MGKAVRKNAKWHLLNEPPDIHLGEFTPRRTRALRQRHCNMCGVPIVAGEEHLSIWYKTDHFFPIRYNICCICGLQELEQAKRKAIHSAMFLSDQIDTVTKYIKERGLELKAQIHRAL